RREIRAYEDRLFLLRLLLTARLGGQSFHQGKIQDRSVRSHGQLFEDQGEVFEQRVDRRFHEQVGVVLALEKQPAGSFRRQEAQIEEGHVRRKVQNPRLQRLGAEGKLRVVLYQERNVI